jgi:hypothetical protein
MQMSFHHLPPHPAIDKSIISIETLAQGNEFLFLCVYVGAALFRAQ